MVNEKGPSVRIRPSTSGNPEWRKKPTNAWNVEKPVSGIQPSKAIKRFTENRTLTDAMIVENPLVGI